MNIEQIKVTQIRVNQKNPREITSTKFQQLIGSILTFPEMLKIRPIVVDNQMKALGGNQRTQALRAISKFPVEEIAQRLHEAPAYSNKSKAEQEKLVNFWGAWLENPVAYIIRADELTDAQKEEFIIKDNVQYGTWNWDALANGFDNSKLNSWGMDVWDTTPTFVAQPSPAPHNVANAPGYGEVDNAPSAEIPADVLPPELQGVDLTPSNLPKIEGTDEVAMDRVIIVYPKDKANEVAGLLGLEKITKVVYPYSEIVGE